MFILISFAKFGPLIYFLGSTLATGLLSQGIAFSCNFFLITPFDPSSRPLREYQEKFLHSAHPPMTHRKQNFLNSVHQTIQVKIIVLSVHLITNTHRTNSVFCLQFLRLFSIMLINTFDYFSPMQFRCSFKLLKCVPTQFPFCQRQ